MKVIKEPSAEWSWLFDCSGCGAKLEAELSDVKSGEFGGGYCERGETRLYVSCPFCQTCAFPKETQKIKTLQKVAARKAGAA